MWRQILQRMGIVPHPKLVRRLKPDKPVHGLFCCPGRYGIEAGEVLCSVPCCLCVAPNISNHIHYGPALMRAVSSHSTTEGMVRVEYSRESALTTVLCAIHMSHGPSDLREYLEWIVVERPDDISMNHALGTELYGHLRTIERINAEIITQLCVDARSVGVPISIETMKRAHAICSSRCVDVPTHADIFGGPALVPFVDLINHSSEDPNITVAVESFPFLHCEQNQMLLEHFYVTVRAEGGIHPEEELHYQYLEPTDRQSTNPLYWASRFHMFD
ncbi:hypothetical protein, conserved [Trypanosoma brucei brucei TREU927]|uniref:Uncharacterized protein n=1 Tax=Trypanosoma brucei brucei (strain 927/4 GUTat10.1) TaxID=185431 RepID=Q57V07_TRYB2|nr:hypothetical protein, conserved [Trypanosoma brucei brucei TREU927]AAX70562.1 hypothetical protein, conserved [Trypanosoma brucei]AAZ12268.1 hypothetical protein, conserved [Trypanosoma brucei brucei TREU927]